MLRSKFANFKILLTRLSRLLNLGCTSFNTKFRAVICSLINFKICLRFFVINRMQRASTKACPSNVRGVFTRASLRNCKQTWDLKRGIRGRLRNSSPLVSLLDKRVFKFKVRIFKREICYFVNFKIPFTRKS